ncbi:hypothetical protein ACWATR_14340 [Nostoc sp. UIC 10890]|jgi:hypothetical protein
MNTVHNEGMKIFLFQSPVPNPYFQGRFNEAIANLSKQMKKLEEYRTALISEYPSLL